MEGLLGIERGNYNLAVLVWFISLPLPKSSVPARAAASHRPAFSRSPFDLWTLSHRILGAQVGWGKPFPNSRWFCLKNLVFLGHDSLVSALHLFLGFREDSQATYLYWIIGLSYLENVTFNFPPCFGCSVACWMRSPFYGIIVYLLEHYANLCCIISTGFAFLWWCFIQEIKLLVIIVIDLLWRFDEGIFGRFRGLLFFMDVVYMVSLL